jgi:ABC-type proline/glycine betaine transport system permease subunit
MRAFAILPAAGLGIWIIYAVSGNNLEPYAKGAIFVFTFSLSVFALVNIYAKKGLFQQPNTKAPKTS